MKHKITWLFILFIGAFASNQALAQIGIDENNPDPYSILEMEATDKGVLLPRMTTNERFALKTSCGTNCPDGLLVYDTDKSAFFYFISNTWYQLNPWVAEDAAQNAADDMQTHSIIGDVGIGKAPDATYKFDVDGNSYLEGEVDIVDDLTIETGDVTLEQGDLKLLQGSMEINGSYKTTQGHFIANTSQTNRYSSDVTTTNVAGPVPRGGIIMWSGPISSIPAGWALCDGTNGTPDLSGRFVIGYGSRPRRTKSPSGTLIGITDVFNLNDDGGFDGVILSVDQLAKHNHSASTGSAGSHRHELRYETTGIDHGSDGDMADDIGQGINDEQGNTEFAGSHTHSVTVADAGDNEPHDNLPPYYVLAYIMKR